MIIFQIVNILIIEISQANRTINGKYVPEFTYDQIEKLLKLQNKNYKERLRRLETRKSDRNLRRNSTKSKYIICS